MLNQLTEHHTQHSKSSTSPDGISGYKDGTDASPVEYAVSTKVDQGDLKSKQHNCRFWKTYKIFFGVVVIHVYELSKKSSNEASGVRFTEDDTCSTALEIQFTPQVWLARKASYITGVWKSSPHMSAWKFNIQSYPVVDRNSEIFQACGNGDIERMKALFDSRQASPYDITQFGETLLLVRTP